MARHSNPRILDDQDVRYFTNQYIALGSHVFAKQFARLLVSNTCMRCNKKHPFKGNKTNPALSVHRIQPSRNGGNYRYNNVRVLCASCHNIEERFPLSEKQKLESLTNYVTRKLNAGLLTCDMIQRYALKAGVAHIIPSLRTSRSIIARQRTTHRRKSRLTTDRNAYKSNIPMSEFMSVLFLPSKEGELRWLKRS
jgi:hypothetical protein